MEISRETDDYIRESIEHTLGLPVSTQTLQLKLQASEQSLLLLRNQCLFLQSKLKEKDDVVERTRAEASMNAVALKKFVEENQRLAVECSNLLAQCKRWERECSLYDRDREALMDFGNEADQRAKEAEIRVRELEEEVQKMEEEFRFYKYEAQQVKVDTSGEDASTGQVLLESLLASIMGKDEVQSKAHGFLEANSNVEVCKMLLKTWNRLRPSDHKVLALAAEVKTLQKDKEHLLINLHRAEEEVKVLFEENNMLDEENKRILELYHREKHSSSSGGKNSGCTSTKGNKRKSCSKTNSSIERKIDFSNVDSSRLPLSPLRENSPECRAYKK
nr:centlein isoform X1 [Ipomoea batatas]